MPMINTEKASTALKVEPRQVRNLIRLAKYLWSLSEDYAHFDMATYFDPDDKGFSSLNDLPQHFTKAKLNSCGAVACAIGHSLAIDTMELTKSNVSMWCSLAKDLYGQTDMGENFGRYLFSAEWIEHDNTSKGAAMRITYLLCTIELNLTAGDMSYLQSGYTPDDLPEVD